MIKFAFIILACCVSNLISAQNLFPKKLTNCITEHFCLDCGDIKAIVEQEKFDKLIEALTSANNLRNIKGKVMFQILIDSMGKGCVLSHTDVMENTISKNIIAALNSFDGFIPAMQKGEKIDRTSINMVFEIKDEKIIAKIERVNMKAFEASFDRPQSPEIYNTKYAYKNKNLKKYRITVWDTKNSNLPNNTNDHIAIDKKGIIWLTTGRGFVKFDGKEFHNEEKNLLDNARFLSHFPISSDNDNIKWIQGAKNIYSYNDTSWKKYDPAEIGLSFVYNIINSPVASEVFFCSDTGVIIYKNKSWTKLEDDKLKHFPSSRILFARRDFKNRIWIGTFKGSLLIDENQKITNFNETETVLKGKCITTMDEDNDGNIYMGLYEFDRKSKQSVNNDEGIAICKADGSIIQYTSSNSGMPFNHVTKVLYDAKEKILWIATDRAGLVRYDLNGNWENYHSDNSDIPTSYIADMAFDQNGVLYLATRQGLVRLERK